MHEARLYEKREKNTVRCSLCSHRCTIQEGKKGICGVRINREGMLYAGTYGRVSAENVDPIEKKPLYHYMPGTLSYSLGSIGCNFRCEHCQNWQISQAALEGAYLKEITPKEAVRRAKNTGSASISFTYNEPTIWHEYALDTGLLARQEGLGTVYVTNGYMTEEALRELAPMLEAFRVDLKSFSDDFYRKVCKARLQPVLDATVIAKELGMHIETVTLVIPGMNDSEEEMGGLIKWVLDHLGNSTPMHFTRFHPDFRMLDGHATLIPTLERVQRQAREMGVRYAYLGNVPGHPLENTWCPSCNALLIERTGYRTAIRNLKGDRCSSCGEKIEIARHEQGKD
ncbi:MAG: AmmeMemoRadiSam system radical SAM enzyme [Methanomicrobiales archaeon]|nr:AmmeMemoRadiSam system radical SAM enzyme [Methanomicrobiales archaeon]